MLIAWLGVSARGTLHMQAVEGEGAHMAAIPPDSSDQLPQRLCWRINQTCLSLSRCQESSEVSNSQGSNKLLAVILNRSRLSAAWLEHTRGTVP